MVQLTKPTLIEDPTDPGTYLIQNMSFDAVSPGSGYPSTGEQPPITPNLVWGTVGQKFYETGIDRGVLYVDGQGIAWSGLVSVKEASSGGEPTAFYIDGVKYYNHPSPEEFSATLEAYTYPDEFAECDGTVELDYGVSATQQTRKLFGLSYRTLIGNDLQAAGRDYKIHIVYNVLASPSDKTYGTMESATTPSVFSWGLSTTPIIVPGFRPISHLVIDSRKIDSLGLRVIESILYGTPTTPATLPSLEEMLEYVGNTVPMAIEPQVDTGLADIVNTLPSDIYNGYRHGLYKATPNTRLVASSTPGLYKLEL